MLYVVMNRAGKPELQEPIRIRRVVEVARPAKIILFGSAARERMAHWHRFGSAGDPAWSRRLGSD